MFPMDLGNNNNNNNNNNNPRFAGANPSTSVGFEPANLGSRGEHVTPRTPIPTPSMVTGK